jgi:hypothetical protein
MKQRGTDCPLKGGRTGDRLSVPTDALFRQDHAMEFTPVGGSPVHDALQQFYFVLAEIGYFAVDKRADVFRQSIA